MSTIEPLDDETMTEPWDDLAASAPHALAPQAPTTIVPSGSIAGRSLTAVVAIMTFLAALTAGAVTMMVGTASDWQSDVGREVTIQVRPVSGRDIEADVRTAVTLAQSTAGIADVRAYTKEESAKLVEPWLGSGLALNDLPIPRMIVVKLVSGATPDFAALRKTLAAQVPSASLDDHRGWIDRMRAMADTAVAVGIAILALVIAVTVLSVTFATRGAMATNRADRRSAALCRCDRQLRRSANSSATFSSSASKAAPSAAAPQSRCSPSSPPLMRGFPARRAATRPRPCSAPFPSALRATSSSWP